MYSYG